MQKSSEVVAPLDLHTARLGILNWGRDTPAWEGIDFHLIPLDQRPEYLDLAVQRFEDLFNASPARTTSKVTFTLKRGRTMARLVISDASRGERNYAFVDINFKADPERYGGLMKPATWKAPEPKKYVRAHLFAPDPLRGTTWYGPEYMEGGQKGGLEKDERDNWFRRWK